MGGRAINIGCGTRFHAEWVNLDIAPAPGVTSWDVRGPLPVASGQASFVYSCHVLEHLDPESAHKLLREILRVLTPGHWVRIVVPDLEKLARWYLEALAGEAGVTLEWSRIHLLDQMVRRRPGGEMRDFLLRANDVERALAVARMGSEASDIFREPNRHPSPGFIERLLQGKIAQRVRRRMGLPLLQGLALSILGERGREALAAGWFGTSGESHRWMYDRKNLTELLCATGFVACVPRDPVSSGWGEWGRYNLDVCPDGTSYKPDSLYMEAQKPERPQPSVVP
jgi:predicted SAM-dependent methyltransferase